MAELIGQLPRAEREGRLHERIRFFARASLLIVDEIGYLPVVPGGGINRFYYQNHDQLRRPLSDFVSAYNFARRLKPLRSLTPFEFICKIWMTEPNRFTSNPLHQMPGLSI